MHLTVLPSSSHAAVTPEPNNAPKHNCPHLYLHTNTPHIHTYMHAHTNPVINTLNLSPCAQQTSCRKTLVPAAQQHPPHTLVSLNPVCVQNASQYTHNTRVCVLCMAAAAGFEGCWEGEAARCWGFVCVGVCAGFYGLRGWHGCALCCVCAVVVCVVGCRVCYGMGFNKVELTGWGFVLVRCVGVCGCGCLLFCIVCESHRVE